MNKLEICKMAYIPAGVYHNNRYLSVGERIEIEEKLKSLGFEVDWISKTDD